MVDSFKAYIVGFFSLSPVLEPPSGVQAPLLRPSDERHQATLQGPIFKPPSGKSTGPGSDFVCNYTSMVNWTSCSSDEDRTCWLRNVNTGEEYNLTTDYEKFAPNGTHRFYELNVTDGVSINADGLAFDQAKLFNGQYPGPLIQACWGDVSKQLLPIASSNALHHADKVHRMSQSQSTTIWPSMAVTALAFIGMDLDSGKPCIWMASMA